MVYSILNRTVKIRKLYYLNFLVVISQKVQLLSAVRLSLLRPVHNQLQLRKISPSIVSHLQAIKVTILPNSVILFSAPLHWQAMICACRPSFGARSGSNPLLLYKVKKLMHNARIFKDWAPLSQIWTTV